MILYIDTKNPKIVTVALKQDGKIRKSISEENEHGSQVLLPLILKLLPLASPTGGPRGWDVVEGIEVEEGPGSFTGLRVGASIAQALGFALNIPVNGQVGKQLNLKYT